MASAGSGGRGHRLALGPGRAERASEEADLIVRLRDVMEEQLRAREVERLYRDVELPLADVLARMSGVGVAVDLAGPSHAVRGAAGAPRGADRRDL